MVDIEQKLAVILSHPTQYFSPWFKYIVENSHVVLKVFYLWDFGVESRHDQSFGHSLKWDIPLLEGYEYEFVPNISRDPGTHHFMGLNNPELGARIADWRPDAILMFGYTYLSHLSIMCSPRFYKIPLLMRGDSHDLSRSPGIKSWLKNRLRACLFKRFSGFLAVGKANTEYFQHCNVPDSKIYFVPHCVDNLRFQSAANQALQDAAVWRAELGISGAATVLLFAGKFENTKRPQDLVDAFLKLRSEGAAKECYLMMSGAGALESLLKSRAGTELGVSIFFAPFQNQTLMPKVYAFGDVLVLPSAGETWGLAVNEAMNLAKPVIVSSRVGCGPDLVIDDVTGWVFEAGDPTALTGVLQKVLSLDKARLQAVGYAARKHVDRYSYKQATFGLIKAIHSLRGFKNGN